MRLFAEDPTPDEPVVDHPDQQAPMESSVRACEICRKPSPESAICDDCDLAEARRWGYR